jgi:hypothetical protein
MAININHTNNTLSSNSGTFVFGTGIVPSIENAVYSANFSGKYYGDGSALTGLPASSPFTEIGIESYDYCGSPVFKSGSYFRTGSNVERSNFSSVIQGTQGCLLYSDYSIILNGSLNCSTSSEYNLIFGKNNEIYSSANSVSIGSYNVNNYGKDNYIIGLSNNISAGCSIYIVGSGINLGSNGSGNTLYANNFCAYEGKYYGDGSALTGVVSSVNRCQVVAKNTTPFDICAVTRVASTYISSEAITNAGGNGAFYLCDHDDNSNDDCILYVINNGYCAAQFSAMILGNAEYAGGTVFVTSMKIDGLVTCDGVVNQSKVIHSKAFPTDDACVILDGANLKIYITGSQTGMNWGTRMDILGMQGYD